MPNGGARPGTPNRKRLQIYPEMVFLTNLGVNLHVCLCGEHQVASAQTLDFLGMG
ncbi:hypothetical protein TRIP_B200540 [uncultured Desulfatiglans sp.]|uniref:Uncharacterized protein n=1 Tax=Uncultured Desulfatiglans sp. TaxID=1748965 RepID=A0A653A303_UNCDX|nr:hypothetical protein TRIP_B200540 [uncultured Desulfatiglans sp.]